jgi:hypothetical protein
MERVQLLTMVNAYLRPFPNYKEVPLVSIAILVRPELRVTFGSRLWLYWRPFHFHAIYHLYHGARTGSDVPGAVLALVGAGNGGIAWLHAVAPSLRR